MALVQHRSRRKPSGGRYVSSRGKRLFESGNKATLTVIGEEKQKSLRIIGGNMKMRLLRSDKINLMDPKTKKSSIVKVKTVVENPANKNYVRRNILTKGTIVETEKGKARITNRPGQEGTLNGVLI